MRSNADELIRALTPAIEQKCGELQRARKERLQSRLFVLLCAMVVFVPALLVFAGISLTMLLAPLGFMSLSVLLLLPVLLSGRTEKQGGIMYEQAENMLSKWNFQKIVIWYLILAVIAGVTCGGIVGYLYRERLDFAWQYSHLEETKDADALKAAADKTAAASGDVVDVLILDGVQQVTYSAKNSAFAAGPLELTKVGNEKKYLVSAAYPDAVFQYVKSEEFMFNSIINRDFGKIRSDYDDDTVFERELSSKTIYMLSRIRTHGSNSTVYVITVPTNVPGGMIALKVTGALAMLFFCVYWVLVTLWLYRDAAKCRLSPLYWGLIGLFTNIIGLIVYKIYKHSGAICSSCGAAQAADYLYCSFCGSQLGTRCEGCGAKVGVKDCFCHQCGHQIK